MEERLTTNGENAQRTEFRLKSVKLLPLRGIDVQYELVSEDDARAYRIKTTATVHEDLEFLFEKPLSGAVSDLFDLPGVMVTAIKLSGEGENAKVRLSGEIPSLHGDAYFHTTPIHYNQGDGFQTVFGKVIPMIVDEVYKYLFEGKVDEKDDSFLVY